MPDARTLAYIAAPKGSANAAVALFNLAAAWGRESIWPKPGFALDSATSLEAAVKLGAELWILLPHEGPDPDTRATLDAWERAGGTEARIRRFLRDGDDFIEAP